MSSHLNWNNDDLLRDGADKEGWQFVVKVIWALVSKKQRIFFAILVLHCVRCTNPLSLNTRFRLSKGGTN